MNTSKSKIKDICDVSDCLHVTPEYEDNGFKMVRVSDIGNDFLDLTEAVCVSEENFAEYTKNYVPQQGDIILARVGAFLGQFAYVDTDESFCIGQNTTILHPKKNGKYIYYNLISDVTQTRIQKEAAGSAYKSVGVDALKEFEIVVPEDEEATKIGEFLYKIDKKIQVHNSINKNVQELASIVYDYWFTQFDYPDNNGKPYQSSGGKMVWNEELKREIPEGWSVKKLSELLTKNSEAFDYDSVEPAIDLSVMPSDSIALSRINSSDNFTTNLFNMKKGDILFGSIRPYLHKAGIAPCDGVVAGTIHSYRVNNENDYNYLLMTLVHQRFFEYAVNSSTGTKMPVISSDSILDYKIPYSPEIAACYNKLNIKDIIIQNVEVIQELMKEKEFFLPTLMSGQVSF